jgi:hypothetical protein
MELLFYLFVQDCVQAVITEVVLKRTGLCINNLAALPCDKLNDLQTLQFTRNGDCRIADASREVDCAQLIDVLTCRPNRVGEILCSRGCRMGSCLGLLVKDKVACDTSSQVHRRWPRDSGWPETL